MVTLYDIDALEKRVKELEAENERLRKALEAVEFVSMAEISADHEGAYYTPVDTCPWCMVDYRRHAEDCGRQLALGLTEG